MSPLSYDERRWVKRQIDAQTRTRLAGHRPRTDRQLARMAGDHRRRSLAASAHRPS